MYRSVERRPYKSSLGNGWEFGDLNTAMMAAIMAEQIARSKRLEEAEQLKRLQRLEELERLKQQTIDAQQRSKVSYFPTILR